MRRASSWARPWRGVLAGALALALSFACSEDERTGPRGSSATHFLEACTASCEGGFTCVCGVCTRSCTSHGECSAIADGASCVDRSSAHPACEVATPERVCDLPCDSDRACAGLPSARHCIAGYCRAAAPGTDLDAGSGGISGMDSGTGGSSPLGQGGSAAGAGGGSGGTPDGGSGGASSQGGSDASADGGSSGGGADAGSDAATSGGAQSTGLAEAVSGSRLKALFHQGADGARHYRRGRLHDSLLGVSCAFQRAADGVSRCLPSLSPGGESAMVQFADDQCTQPFASLPEPPAGCTPQWPRYVVAGRADTTSACGAPGTTHVYPVEGTILASSPRYRLSGTSCLPDPSTAVGTVLVRLGSEVAATEFVAGTRTSEP